MSLYIHVTNTTGQDTDQPHQPRKCLWLLPAIPSSPADNRWCDFYHHYGDMIKMVFLENKSDSGLLLQQCRHSFTICSLSTLYGPCFVIGPSSNTKKLMARWEIRIVKDRVLVIKGPEFSHWEKMTGECGLKYGGEGSRTVNS